MQKSCKTAKIQIFPEQREAGVKEEFIFTNASLALRSCC